MAITVGGVLKSALVGSAVCGVAIIAPIGAPVVAGLTAAAFGTNLLVEKIADDIRKKSDDKKKRSSEAD